MSTGERFKKKVTLSDTVWLEGQPHSSRSLECSRCRLWCPHVPLENAFVQKDMFPPDSPGSQACSLKG